MSGQNSMPNPPALAHDPTTLSGVFAAHLKQAIRAFIGHEARRDHTVALSRSMNSVFNRTLAGVLHEWNGAHSQTAQLPTEILVHCVSYLPWKDVFSSIAVCASWRNIILRAPELWTDLDLSDVGTRFLGQFLRRGNGTHSVKLKLVVVLDNCISDIKKHLPANLHRVRHLEVDNMFASVERDWLFKILDRPAPLLETFICRHRVVGTHPGLFKQHAPRLRVLDISMCAFSSPCPAFERVTILHLRKWQPHFEELSMIRTICIPPDLQELHIYDTCSAALIPLLRTPSYTRVSLHITDPQGNHNTIIAVISHFLPSSLHHIEFLTPCNSRRLQDVIHYLRLCDITTPTGVVIQSSSDVFITLHRSDLSARASLHVHCSLFHFQETRELGPGTVFSHFPFSFGDLVEMTISSTISWLEMNVASRSTTEPQPPTEFVFFPPSLEFGELRTLRILGGDRDRPDSPDTMFDPLYMRHRGVLRVPSLRCVSMERAPEARWALAPIPPRMLALFISQHIAFDEDLLPELVVRVRDGVHLEDAEDGGAALEVLQSFVRTLTFL